MSEPIPLWPGVAPGSEGWTQEETTFTGVAGDLLIRNVVVPTLTPYLPEAPAATGTAVVVAPGGAFQMLSWEWEGVKVAELLARRGVTAFVLKYRVADTGATQEDFLRISSALMSRFTDADGKLKMILDRREVEPAASDLAVADGAQAVRLVRERAREWAVDPERVGFLGFSAGAFVTTAIALGEEAARPNFVAPIYGGSVEAPITADAPPLFCVVAADDPICLETCLATFGAWGAGGSPTELHVYSKGGHGFGVRPLGLPVDSWFDRLVDWMHLLGYVGTPSRPGDLVSP